MIYVLYLFIAVLIYAAIVEVATEITYYKLTKNRSIEEIQNLIALKQIYKNKK